MTTPHPPMPVRIRLALALILMLSACQGRHIPGQLISRWVTDNTRYEACYLDISDNYIVYGNQENGVQAFVINKILLAHWYHEGRLTIEYEDLQGTTYTREVVYSEKNGGRLWFKNQPGVIWRPARGRHNPRERH